MIFPISKFAPINSVSITLSLPVFLRNLFTKLDMWNTYTSVSDSCSLKSKYKIVLVCVTCRKEWKQAFFRCSSLWLANSFFFCIGHFSKLCCCCGASNFYPIITLCLTDCWNCLARGLILVPNSMYCLKVVFWVLFFASEELRNEQKLHLLLSSWKTVRIWKKKQKYQCLKMSQICLLLQELRAKRAWMKNIQIVSSKKLWTWNSLS